MTTSGRLLRSILIAAIVLVIPALAHATPVLQVWMPGATYNDATESWDFTPADGTAIVVVMAALPAGEALTDVTLAVAYDSSNQNPNITLLDDMTAPVSGISGSGGVPAGLSPHGVYGAGTSYVLFDLGSFTGDGDVIWNTVDGTGQTEGDLRAYQLTIAGITGTIHLDAFGTNEKGQTKFAPYSHDGDIIGPPPSSTTDVPELSGNGAAPAGALLLGLGLLFAARRRQASTAA